MQNKTLALLWSLAQIILTTAVILVTKFIFNTGVAMERLHRGQQVKVDEDAGPVTISSTGK